jgi:hypothetical protein
MPAESKRSDQVKSLPAAPSSSSSTSSLQKCPGRKPAKSPDLCRYSFRFVFFLERIPAHHASRIKSVCSGEKPASSTFIQQVNLVLAEMTGQETRKEP